ncbi:hypothetical protein MUGA111182_05795 [Mucilaginibacter galii]|uniref:TonB C-terminal domain-containing protein n=1 Tax=Mucilaginibacter galii TaxID=2005073 RepID=A0A917J9N5_9SPHI|nr:hypothetical protein [Mucilaginibacter galii]GGI49976.1 hypothetical protein GCM10011425_11880 [Mucilaginibacter galii]
MKACLLIVLFSITSLNLFGQTKDAAFVNKYNINKYIARSFRFPEQSTNRGLQTILLLSFRVTKSSQIDSVKLIGNTGGLDSIMLQAFKNVINRKDFIWKAAMKNGNHVDSYIVIPFSILFEIGDQPIEGELLKVEDYQGSYHAIMDYLYSIRNKYQLYPEIIMQHYGSVR